MGNEKMELRFLPPSKTINQPIKNASKNKLDQFDLPTPMMLPK
jgi:hypothetical protein